MKLRITEATSRTTTKRHKNSGLSQSLSASFALIKSFGIEYFWIRIKIGVSVESIDWYNYFYAFFNQHTFSIEIG